jgi:hypothetical protein
MIGDIRYLPTVAWAKVGGPRFAVRFEEVVF